MRRHVVSGDADGFDSFPSPQTSCHPPTLTPRTSFSLLPSLPPRISEVDSEGEVKMNI